MSQFTRYRHRLKQSLSPVMTPILGGPLKGQWFGLFTGSRFLRGVYSQSEVGLLQSLIKPGDVVYDVGAHVGYFTLVASQIVGDAGRVMAFEPSPVNLAYLEWHKRANQAGNVRVVPAAVGDQDGALSFDNRSGTGRGRLVESAAGCVTVQVKQLDAMLQRGEMPAPNFIKMDVEGAEGSALRGASRLLEKYRPRILLSLHGPAAACECREVLNSLGLELRVVGRGLVLVEPAELTIRTAYRSAA